MMEPDLGELYQNKLVCMLTSVVIWLIWQLGLLAYTYGTRLTVRRPIMSGLSLSSWNEFEWYVQLSQNQQASPGLITDNFNILSQQSHRQRSLSVGSLKFSEVCRVCLRYCYVISRSCLNVLTSKTPHSTQLWVCGS